jgi:hypothetical protein
MKIIDAFCFAKASLFTSSQATISIILTKGTGSTWIYTSGGAFVGPLYLKFRLSGELSYWD